jgi:TolB-like protein/Tfp pilus assembly protein PilF
MSFFKELKRRNVFRVGIAYIVVAWLVAQVLDLVLESFGAPPWFMRSLLVVLAAGLPLALVFAWAFEMTPEGLKKEKDIDRSQSVTHQTGRKLDRMIIGIMAVVIAFLVIDRFVLKDTDTPPVAVTETQTTDTEEETAPPDASGPSVAVLPFVNMSGDANNEYFSDGLTETLLHMLAQLPELRVAARTSSFAFKGKETGIAEISEILGVAHILEGSVQKAGNRVRITAQLIRADDGFHVWSQNYDRTLDDIFAIQDEIATDVASALDASLMGASSPALHGVSTRNTKAYDIFLQALEQQSVSSYSSLGVAEGLLKNALAIDPGFIEAKLALARNYQMKYGTGLVDKETAWKYMEPLLLQVELDNPGDPMARALTLNFQIQNWALGAEASEREAIISELRSLLPEIPTDTWVREIVARILRLYNAHDDALEVLQAGLLVDPLSANLHRRLAQLYQDQERFEEAQAAFLKALELAPDNPNTYSEMGHLIEERGDLASALDWKRQAIEKDPQDHELVAELANDLFELDLAEEGKRWASRCYALAPQTAVCRALQIREARAQNDPARALELAIGMLNDDVSLRRFSWGTALRTYKDTMIDQGRTQEAFEFLVSRYPGIENFEQVPENFKTLVARSSGVELMSYFATRNEYLAALKLVEKHQRDAQLPWLDDPWRRVTRHLMHGETEQAREVALNEELSEDVASSLNLKYRYSTPLYRELSASPEIAARLRERESETAVLRAEVSEMLLQPEWNQ